ncbi:MAG TPA: DUF2269 family protein [Acidimicrobiia bacterium]|nr:DUF2269 family protein [Acidimicrobiia bacterium]
MTLHNWLLFAHVLAAMIWVGGGIVDLTISRRMMGVDAATARAFAAAREWTLTRVVLPATVLVPVVGISMVAESDVWSFGQTWIWLSLTLVVAVVVGGAIVAAVDTPRLRRLADERGLDDPEYLRLQSRHENVINSVFLTVLIVVFLMIFKPGV